MGLTWSVPHYKMDSVVPNGIGARIFLKTSWRVYLQRQTGINDPQTKLSVIYLSPLLLLTANRCTTA